MPVTISIQFSGGLGNRLFQLAFLYTLCRRAGAYMHIANPTYTTIHSSQKYVYLTTRFHHLSNYNHMFTLEHVRPTVREEWAWEYTDYVPWLADNTLFIGYFQHIRYFREYAHNIRMLFRKPDNLFLPWIPEPKSIFLHIRLGDFFTHPFLFLGMDTYTLFLTSALRDVPPDVTKIYVFSNDMNHAQVLFPAAFADRRVQVVDEPDELVAFYTMVQCPRGGIGFNSTYAWWAAFLNPNATKWLRFPPVWSTLPYSAMTGPLLQ